MEKKYSMNLECRDKSWLYLSNLLELKIKSKTCGNFQGVQNKYQHSAGIEYLFHTTETTLRYYWLRQIVFMPSGKHVPGAGLAVLKKESMS